MLSCSRRQICPAVTRQAPILRYADSLQGVAYEKQNCSSSSKKSNSVRSSSKQQRSPQVFLYNGVQLGPFRVVQRWCCTNAVYVGLVDVVAILLQPAPMESLNNPSTIHKCTLHCLCWYITTRYPVSCYYTCLYRKIPRACTPAVERVSLCYIFPSLLLFTFQLNLKYTDTCIGFTLSCLLDKPWSHMEPLSSPQYIGVPSFWSCIGARSPRWSTSQPSRLLRARFNEALFSKIESITNRLFFLTNRVEFKSIRRESCYGFY